MACIAAALCVVVVAFIGVHLWGKEHPLTEICPAVATSTYRVTYIEEGKSSAVSWDTMDEDLGRILAATRVQKGAKTNLEPSPAFDIRLTDNGVGYSIIVGSDNTISVARLDDLDGTRSFWKDCGKQIFSQLSNCVSPTQLPVSPFVVSTMEPWEETVERVYAWGDWDELTHQYPDEWEEMSKDDKNAWICAELDAWAERYQIGYDFSDEDMDSAIRVVREELDDWAAQPYTISFEVHELAPSRAETLAHRRSRFEIHSTFFTDWTKEDMERNMLVVTALYTCEYDGTLTPLESGDLACQFALIRDENGGWTIEDAYWNPSALWY